MQRRKFSREFKIESVRSLGARTRHSQMKPEQLASDRAQA